MLFKSSAVKKYKEFIEYYRWHPFKYIKLFEKTYNVKLTLIQKILLFIPTKEQLKQRKMERLLKRFIKK